MSKKAFCVGINDYPYQGWDLFGCVNDVNAWAKLLIDHYDFPKSDVEIITNSQATKQNIIKGLKKLLKGAGTGDLLVFINASHGSYVFDDSGDEVKYDEIICPYNVKDEELKDDELRELFTDLSKGVKLTVISDSCFSGTITRDLRRRRFLDPKLRGCQRITNPSRLKEKKQEKFPESDMKELVLAGCTDREFAYDDMFDNVNHGAMSYFTLQSIKEANYKITYSELVKQVNRKLEQAHFPQHPQLEGKQENKDQQIFVYATK